MFDEIIDELIAEDKLGETWKLEMAPNHARYSFSSTKSGDERWAKLLGMNLVKKEKEDFKFIGAYSEGESTEGPIVVGYVFHCTQEYLDKVPHMHRDKRKACKQHIKTGKPVEYMED